MNMTTLVASVREALELEIAEAKQDIITDTDGSAHQYAFDSERALDTFNEICARGDVETALQDFGPGWTTLFSAVNARVRIALNDLLESGITDSTMDLFRESTERFILAAEWLHTIYNRAYSEENRPVNATPFPSVAADVIAARAISQNPERVDEILEMRDLSRALGDLDRQALRARLDETEDVRNSGDRVFYYSSRLKNAVVLARAVADRYQESDIVGFDARAYDDLTRNLQYVDQLLQSE